ncbi:MAG: hypothetical protein HY610_01720 [Elusimicrobia bacterium]|nr:hypothetical protein [Elusimicrobiota bacterium]
MWADLMAQTEAVAIAAEKKQAIGYAATSEGTQIHVTLRDLYPDFRGLKELFNRPNGNQLLLPFPDIPTGIVGFAPGQLNLSGDRWWVAALKESFGLATIVAGLPALWIYLVWNLTSASGLDSSGFLPQILLGIYWVTVLIAGQVIAGRYFSHLHERKGIQVGDLPFTLQRRSFIALLVVVTVASLLGWSLPLILWGSALTWFMAHLLPHLLRNFKYREEDRIREIQRILRVLPLMSERERIKAEKKLSIQVSKYVDQSDAVRKNSKDAELVRRALWLLGSDYLLNTGAQSGGYEEKYRQISGQEISALLQPQEKLLSRLERISPDEQMNRSLNPAIPQDTFENLEDSFWDGAAHVIQMRQRVAIQENKTASVRFQDLVLSPKSALAADLSELKNRTVKVGYLVSQVEDALRQMKSTGGDSASAQMVFVSNWGNKAKLLKLLKQRISRDLWDDLDKIEFRFQKRLDADLLYFDLGRPAGLTILTDNEMKWGVSRWAEILIVTSPSTVQVLRSLRTTIEYLKSKQTFSGSA